MKLYKSYYTKTNTIPGISIDINFISLFISRFSLRILLRDYPDSYANHYIWQKSPSNLSESELGLIPFDEFNKIEKCPICSLKSKTPFISRKTNIKIQLLEIKLFK